ncbi:ATP-binding protein [Kitasatospora sp. NPDC101801]|uniref:ATP-binding protein n=1 Tax=Kitasatospora sp. NPDC101801 TaxID=3364103 RepID=UPI0037F8EBE7
MSEGTNKYDASHIQVLEGLDAVRKRPGMYVGSTDERGLRNVVFSAADRAVGEVLSGRAGRVEVTLTADGGVYVTDDGPGAPIDEMRDAPVRRSLKEELTVLSGGWGFGLELAVVNALSSRLTAEVRCDGVRWVQEYVRGVAVAPPVNAGPTVGQGTTIAFWPDTEIFGTAEVSFDALLDRFRELAFVNPGLDISLTDRRLPGASRSERLRFPGGVRDFVSFLGEQAGEPVHPEVIGFEQEGAPVAGEVAVAVALRWCDSPEERIRSFANSWATPGGGTHQEGFRAGVAAAVNAYARTQRLLAEADPDLGTERIGEGLTAVVAVKVDRLGFEGPLRDRLGNTEARDRVERAVREYLGGWLTAHPEQAAAIVGRLVRGAHQG